MILWLVIICICNGMHTQLHRNYPTHQILRKSYSKRVIAPKACQKQPDFSENLWRIEGKESSTIQFIKKGPYASNAYTGNAQLWEAIKLPEMKKPAYYICPAGTYSTLKELEEACYLRFENYYAEYALEKSLQAVLKSMIVADELMGQISPALRYEELPLPGEVKTDAFNIAVRLISEPFVIVPYDLHHQHALIHSPELHLSWSDKFQLWVFKGPEICK